MLKGQPRGKKKPVDYPIVSDRFLSICRTSSKVLQSQVGGVVRPAKRGRRSFRTRPDRRNSLLAAARPAITSPQSTACHLCAPPERTKGPRHDVEKCQLQIGKGVMSLPVAYHKLR
jgi:hypothetical protein